ncbi:MAG: hypothetical protein LBN95_12595, partial [Prevotellaceae bacterium]|nr:hypothetical protein [Prevotellaceae bacterium]
MKKNYILILSLIVSLSITAQTTEYKWQWAKSGGTPIFNTYSNPTSQTPLYPKMEQVKYTFVDKNDNIYFGAQIGGGDEPHYYAMFNGQPVSTNNMYNSNGNITYTDVFIASVDCDGNSRWNYVVGSRDTDFINGMGMDTLGGVYAAIDVSPFDETFFGNNDTVLYANINGPMENKVCHYNVTILKLDTLGNFQWIHQPEGVLPTGVIDGSHCFILGFAVEPDGNIHLLLQNYMPQTFENGQVVIDDAMLAQSDMMVMKYNSSGQFLGVVHLPVHDLKSIYEENPFYFKYSVAANCYYLAGRPAYLSRAIIAGDTVYGNGYYSPNIYTDAESYVAAFDANTGNHKWHHIGKPGISINGTTNGISASVMYSVDTDQVGNIYVNTIAREFEANSVSDSAKYRTIKISPVGYIVWSYNSSKKVDQRDVLVWNNNEISGFGNIEYLYIDGQMKPAYLTKQSEWIISRHSASTGTQLSYDTWLSEPYNNGITAYTNSPVCGAVDLHGNYVFGGAIGTKFYLGADSTILLENSGSMKDADFWIGKYGQYTCSDPIEP